MSHDRTLRVGIFTSNPFLYSAQAGREQAALSLIDEIRERQMIIDAFSKSDKMVDIITSQGDANSFAELLLGDIQILHFASYFPDSRALRGIPLEDTFGCAEYLPDEDLKKLLAGKASQVIIVLYARIPSQIAKSLVDCGAAHVVCIERKDRTPAEEDEISRTFLSALYRRLAKGEALDSAFIGAKSSTQGQAYRHMFKLLPERASQDIVIGGRFVNDGPVWDSTTLLPACNLPVPPQLHGREIYAHKCLVALKKSRRLVIYGPAATGKSLLLTTVARYMWMRRFYPHGVFYANLQYAKGADDVMAALSLAFTKRYSFLSELGREWEYGRMLIVLDNAEAVDHIALEVMNGIHTRCAHAAVAISVTGNAAHFKHTLKPKLLVHLADVDRVDSARMLTVYTPRSVSVPIACLASDEFNYSYASKKLDKTPFFDAVGLHPVGVRISYGVMQHISMDKFEEILAKARPLLAQQSWARTISDDHLAMAILASLIWLRNEKPAWFRVLQMIALFPSGLGDDDLTALFGSGYQSIVEILVSMGFVSTSPVNVGKSTLANHWTIVRQARHAVIELSLEEDIRVAGHQAAMHLAGLLSSIYEQAVVLGNLEKLQNLFSVHAANFEECLFSSRALLIGASHYARPVHSISPDEPVSTIAVIATLLPQIFQQTNQPMSALRCVNAGVEACTLVGDHAGLAACLLVRARLHLPAAEFLRTHTSATAKKKNMRKTQRKPPPSRASHASHASRMSISSGFATKTSDSESRTVPQGVATTKSIAVPSIAAVFADEKRDALERAVSDCREAVNLYAKLGTRQGETVARLQLSATLEDLGLNAEALEGFQTTLTVAKGSQDALSQGVSIAHTAHLLREMGSVEEAERLSDAVVAMKRFLYPTVVAHAQQ